MKKLQNLIHDMHDAIGEWPAIAQIALLFGAAFLVIAGLIAVFN